MLDQWIRHCLDLSEQPADLWSGCRKILRGVQFSLFDLAHDMTMADCGFTKSKSSMLRRNYLHAESREAAKQLWERRSGQEKYGSVGFSCYNHLVKGNGLGYGISSKQTGVPPVPGGTMGGRKLKTPKGHSAETCDCETCTFLRARSSGVQAKNKRASVMGPCIQSVVLTWMKKGHVEVDIFYRTTELLKKFPADLVFIRDELLHDFDLRGLKKVNFHFANVTVHPMYYVTIIPHLGNDVFKELDALKKSDRRMFDWVIKWTARYLCPEHLRGIQKFAQAMRTRQDGLNRIDKKLMVKVQAYLRKHHPGHRNDYIDPDGEDEE